MVGRFLFIFLLLVVCSSSNVEAKPQRKSFESVGSRLVVRSIREGLINCFPKGSKRKGKAATCEVSAVAFDGKRIFLGSDKPIPRQKPSSRPSSRKSSPAVSSIFSIPTKAPDYKLFSQNILYNRNKKLRKTRKFEDFTVTPDGRFVIASSAFDRIKSNGRWDKYNRLVYWAVGKTKVRYFASSLRSSVTGQIPLRSCLKSALKNSEFPQGAPYFKLEGLAAIPAQKGQKDATLLFGIREWGSRYYAYQYTIKIIAIPYYVQGGRLHVKNDCRLIYDFTTRARRVVRRSVALSSLAYDRFRKRLYLLTSYEQSASARGLGAYLWSLPLADLYKNKPAQIARHPNGRIYHFVHKAEGIAVLDSKRLLVVHDDDRVTGGRPVQEPSESFRRKSHQAAYSLLEILP